MKCPYCGSTKVILSTCKKGALCKSCSQRWYIQEINHVIER